MAPFEGGGVLVGEGWERGLLGFWDMTNTLLLLNVHSCRREMKRQCGYEKSHRLLHITQ